MENLELNLTSLGIIARHVEKSRNDLSKYLAKQVRFILLRFVLIVLVFLRCDLVCFRQQPSLPVFYLCSSVCIVGTLLFVAIELFHRKKHSYSFWLNTIIRQNSHLKCREHNNVCFEVMLRLQLAS